MVFRNILESIGNTPLIHLGNFDRPGSLFMAKLEGANPTGSIKDRIALSMIEEAERDGTLTPDKTIIEATSGNTGIALAMIGRVKGYRVKIIMSAAVSQERQLMIKAFGADIILTAAAKGTDGAIHKAREMLKADPQRYFMPDQFTNKYNKITHYKTTAEEIWNQTAGCLDFFVSALGTSGTIMGVGKYLKEKNPAIKIICAHPVKGHYIQGLKNMEEAIVPAIYDPARIDDQIMVESEQAFAMSREIVKREGIFVGMSSGAALYAALKAAEKVCGTYVVIFPDRGEKYLSTKLFSH